MLHEILSWEQTESQSDYLDGIMSLEWLLLCSFAFLVIQFLSQEEELTYHYA